MTEEKEKICKNCVYLGANSIKKDFTTGEKGDADPACFFHLVVQGKPFVALVDTENENCEWCITHIKYVP